MALLISLVTSLVAFLNSLMPWPRPLASSGSFLAPKRIRTTARIKTISQPPNNAANRVFINIVFLMLTLGCPVGPVKPQSGRRQQDQLGAAILRPGGFTVRS